jgi:zinc transport system ATP-binding protein
MTEPTESCPSAPLSDPLLATSCNSCCTRIEGLSARFGTVEVLHGVNLHFHCGELTLLIGPNGAGKTTLLRALLGEIPHTGQISYWDHSRRLRHPRLGYVPQHLSVDPDTPITVADLFRIARKSLFARPHGLDAVEALRPMAAEHLARRRLSALSGGELQRVLLALAMTPRPDILLLDEPVAGVDQAGLILFYRLVCDLRRIHDLSILLVTHDVETAAAHADRVVLLNRTVLADGAPADILSQADQLRTLGMGWAALSKPLSRDPHA